MPNLETPDELADWLADQLDVWGAGERSPWVSDVARRIRESVKNERVLASARDVHLGDIDDDPMGFDEPYEP